MEIGSRGRQLRPSGSGWFHNERGRMPASLRLRSISAGAVSARGHMRIGEKQEKGKLIERDAWYARARRLINCRYDNVY